MKYSDKELAKMEHAEYWASGPGEEHPSAKHGGAVLSVKLSRDDFEVLSAAAEQAGLPVTEFVWVAALKQARRQKPTGFAS